MYCASMYIGCALCVDEQSKFSSRECTQRKWVYYMEYISYPTMPFAANSALNIEYSKYNTH